MSGPYFWNSDSGKLKHNRKRINKKRVKYETQVFPNIREK